MDCVNVLNSFFQICADFRIPLAHEKAIFRSTRLGFLGIIIDTVAMEFEIPADKIVKLKYDIHIIRKRATLKEIQKLLGSLAFASRVLPVGRIFSRHLYLVIAGLKSPSSRVRITSEIREDLLVWAQFLEEFNGRAIFQSEFVMDRDYHLFTNAAQLQTS